MIKKMKVQVINWLNNLWNEVNYYCWRNPKRIIYNFWYFRKAIYNFRDFDYAYNFELFTHSLERTANAMSKRDIHVDADTVGDSIKNFIRLYKKIKEDEYMEEAGCNWDNVRWQFIPIENSECSELVLDSKYTDEEMKNFRIESEKLKKQDFKNMINEFKKFESWWD